MKFEIEPNYRIELAHRVKEDESLFYEESGIRVKEECIYRYPDFEISEKEHVFKTESETMDYLVKRIAEKIASYRHLNSISQQ